MRYMYYIMIHNRDNAVGKRKTSRETVNKKSVQDFHLIHSAGTFLFVCKEEKSKTSIFANHCLLRKTGIKHEYKKNLQIKHFSNALSFPFSYFSFFPQKWKKSQSFKYTDHNLDINWKWGLKT